MMRFPKTIEEANQITTKAVNDFKQSAATMPKTLDELRNLDLAYYQAAKVANIMQVLTILHSDPNLKNTTQSNLLKINELFSKTINGNSELYKLLSNIDLKDITDPEDRYYIQRETRQLMSDGAAVDNQIIQDINRKLEELAMKCVMGIQQSTQMVEIDNEEVNEINRLNLGHFVISNKLAVRPVYQIVMSKSGLSSLRKKVFKAGNMIEGNHQVINEYLELLGVKAALCGFSNPAELNLSTGVINDCNQLEQNLDEWANKLKDSVECELTKLKNFFDIDQLDLWDLPYYTEQYNKSVNKKTNMPVTSLKTLLTNLCNVIGKLFNLKFIHETSVSKDWGLWSADLILYRVETTNDEFLGHIIIDPLNRKGKMQQALTIKVSSRCDMHHDSALAIVNCVINNPMSVSFSDLHSLVHEFGHAVHHMIGKAKWPSVSGSATVTDMVEIISRLFELYLQDEQILRDLLGLTDDNLNLVRELQLLKSNDCMRQVMLAYVCYSYHKNSTLDTKTCPWKEFMDKYLTGINYDPSVNMITRFIPFLTYGVKYYSYAWADYIGHDLMKSQPDNMIKLFKAGGGLDPLMLVNTLLGGKNDPPPTVDG